MVEQDDDVHYPSLGECFASLAEVCTRAFDRSGVFLIV